VFFQKTIYKVKIINLKKFRLNKVSLKVAKNFEVAKKFLIKTKKIEKVQIWQNALRLKGHLNNFCKKRNFWQTLFLD
jgi:hypothetical protein